MKRNEWYWKQERLFVLTLDGTIKYFDIDIVQKGEINMNKQTRCVRDSDKHFELINGDRTYYLFSEKAGVVDQWITDINKVVAAL